MKRSAPPTRFFPGRRTARVLLIACLVALMGGPVLADQGDHDPVEEAGLGVASALLTIPYAPAKMVYAGVGGVIGGVTWLFSGGDTEAAQTVWEPSFYGTYVITPEHLRGEEAVEFFGDSAPAE